MSELERLDEALETWAVELPDMPGQVLVNSEKWPVLYDAARAYRDLLADGQRVEWCETHEQMARHGAESCIMESYLVAQGATLADPCRIVPRLLSLYPKEAENE